MDSCKDFGGVAVAPVIAVIVRIVAPANKEKSRIQIDDLPAVVLSGEHRQYYQVGLAPVRRLGSGLRPQRILRFGIVLSVASSLFAKFLLV